MYVDLKIASLLEMCVSAQGLYISGILGDRYGIFLWLLWMLIHVTMYFLEDG